MLIKRISVSNFRSFDELDIELGSFSVLVGANASGKSNFVSILQLLKDAAEHGLANAISMQGGVDYVRNVNIAGSRNLSIELSVGNSEDWVSSIRVSLGEGGRLIGISPREFTYKISVEFRRAGYKVTEERLVVDCGFVASDKPGGKHETMGEGRIIVRRYGEEVEYYIEPRDLPVAPEEVFAPFSTEAIKERMSAEELVLHSPGFWGLLPPPLAFMVSDFYDDISIFHFDPRLSKRACAITGKTELEPDGANLTIVVRNILRNSPKKRKMYNLIKDLLPLVEDIRVRRLADKSLLATLREVYSGKKFLPAFLMSDGTINMTAIIVALYFEARDVVIIEEPESNIHPYLISKVVDMMKDVAESLNKQVIITTHNPEVVRYAGIENLLLVHRDNQGFSRISRPCEKEEVNTFLQHDMGVEELYVQNLLEW